MKIRTVIVPLALLTALLATVLLLAAPTTAQEGPAPSLGLVGAHQAPEAAAETGAGWEVITFRWDELQPGGPGQWNTSYATADYLAEARGAGREIVAVLVGTPAWATDGEPGTGTPSGLYLPLDDPANVWAAFVRQAVNYGAARGVNRWAVWQAQDIPADIPGATWSGSLEDYYRLVKVAYMVARETNPNALIHLGGIEGDDPDWLASYLDVTLTDLTAPPNDMYFDVVTIHSYYSPERLYTRMGNPFAVMQAQGVPLKEVWANRIGARPAVDPDAYPADASFAQHPNITLDQQAAYIVQAHALGFAANRGARLAVYRLVDDLQADAGAGFGLLREDGSARPAYDAYQLVVEEFSGFVFARRLDDETHPAVEYVRLTFPTKVTHIAWARTSQTSTLVIPARSEQATLIDLRGNRTTIQPEDGAYRLVVEGAACDDPQVGCLIGGAPWLLVEEGLEDPVNELAPESTVEPGGEPLALGPTVTPQPPTSTPTHVATPTAEPTVTATAAPEVAAAPTDIPAGQAGSAEAAGQETVPALPGWLAGWLPTVLIALGALAIVGGVLYYVSGAKLFQRGE